MRLYHYTTIDAFARIWVSNQLKFSTNLRLNDPFEKSKPYSIPFHKTYAHHFFELVEQFDKIYSKIISSYQQISFSKDDKGAYNGFASPAMWGHYAHNENGVCIELDSAKIPSFSKIVKKRSVIYTKNLPAQTYKLENGISEDAIKHYVREHIKELFFMKHRHWRYENEYRIIAQSNEELFLPLGDAIQGIYVCSRAGANTEFVKKLVKDQVPLYVLCNAITKGVRLLDRDLINLKDDTTNSKPTTITDVLQRFYN